MQYQSLINDHTSDCFPSIYTKEELDKVAWHIQYPKDYRDDDIGRWLRARNITIFYITYNCATRPGEILHLKFNDINFEEKTINISAESNKTHKGRTVPIPDKAWQLLCDYLHHLRKQYWNFSDYVFPSLKNQRLSCDRWQEILRFARIEAGLYKPRQKTAYALRHTKATEMYMKKKDPIAVANVLGHKTLESTKVYIHLATLKQGYTEYLRGVMS